MPGVSQIFVQKRHNVWNLMGWVGQGVSSLLRWNKSVQTGEPPRRADVGSAYPFGQLRGDRSHSTSPTQGRLRPFRLPDPSGRSRKGNDESHSRRGESTTKRCA